MKYKDLDQAFDPKPTDKRIACVCAYCGVIYGEYVNGCPKCEKGKVVCISVTEEQFEKLKKRELMSRKLIER